MGGSMKIVVTLTLLIAVALPASSTMPQATPQEGATPAAAPTLKFTFKDINAPGAIETDTYGINDKNMMVGNYIDKSDIPHGMILIGGKKLFTVDCAAGPTTLYGINSSGRAVAQCGLGGDDGGVWVWIPGVGWVWIPIPPPGCPDCPYSVFGINDIEQVVGQWIDPNNLVHGFLVDTIKKTFTSLDVPGSTATTAWGINKSGQITVQAADAAGLVHSYLYHAKTYKNIDVPGAQQTFAHGINNKGDIVFTTFDSAGNSHGALLHAGRYYTFDDPKSNGATRADGINDSLTIVGRYSPNPTSQQNYSFEATVK